MVYFLSEFQVFFLTLLTPFRLSDPISFGIVYTLFFTDSSGQIRQNNKKVSLSPTDSEPFILLQFDTLEKHTIRLCDFASAGAKGMPYISWLPVIDKIWHFSRSDGFVIAKRLQLLQDNRIVGASPTNESTWGLDGDILVFFTNDDKPKPLPGLPQLVP